MLTYDFDEIKKTHHSEPDTSATRIVMPKQPMRRLFGGWGPSLMAVALAAGASAASTPANAAIASDALTCTAQAREATLLSGPIPDMPSIAAQQSAAGDVILRIDLSETGKLERAEILQSSGNPFLDREALRVARQARFAPKIVGCRPAAGSFRYEVSFAS